MTKEITLEHLYQGMHRALTEGLDVPYFDKTTGKRIGTIKKAKWDEDAIIVVVEDDYENYTHYLITQ